MRIFLRNRAASEAEKCGGKHKLPHGCGHSDGGLRFVRVREADAFCLCSCRMQISSGGAENES